MSRILNGGKILLYDLSIWAIKEWIAEIKLYLSKIRDEELYAYGVYQIEADGKSLFDKIEGNEDTIMGLPIKQIKEYLKNFKWKNIL